MPYHSRTVPLTARTFSLADVRLVYQRLQAYITEQGNLELANIVRQPDVPEDQFQLQLEHARTNAYKITVTINGADGSSLYEDHEGIFDSPNLPEEISQIFMTNATAFEGVAGRKPANKVVVNLDLSRPPLLDPNPVSAPTPNFSNLNIEGASEAWIATISDRVVGIMGSRKNRRGFLHAAFVYDIGMMLIALPVILYVCWKASNLVNAHLASVHPVVSATAYIYLSLLTLWAYRGLFGYTKWAFPTVELEGPRSSSARHRRLWAAIAVGLIGKLLYDVLTVLL